VSGKRSASDMENLAMTIISAPHSFSAENLYIDL
jgi:hypothetical protein